MGLSVVRLALSVACLWAMRLAIKEVFTHNAEPGSHDAVNHRHLHLGIVKK
jgi:hypothetical protein